MYKITDIKLGKEDSQGMKYKIVDTTAGSFETRCCAYNQTIERIDDKFRSDTGNELSGPPIKIWTLMYDPEFKSRQKFLCIKQLKESHQTGEKFHGCDIFNGEVNYLKERLTNFNKVVLVNYLIPRTKWGLFDKSDIVSMVSCLCATGTPHITIPISPMWNIEESTEVINSIKTKIGDGQDYFLSLHPHMNLLDQKIIIESLKNDQKFRGIIMNCCTLYDVNNSVSYIQASRMVGNTRLFILVDVDDSMNKTKVPTVIAARLFNVDITCRTVKPYLSGVVFDAESKKARNKLKIYYAPLGALLNEAEQFELTGLSLHEFIAQNMSQITNNNLREMVMAFNFLALNHEGKRERKMIDQDTHGLFIQNRIHLANFVENFFPKPSGK